jgi:hypothetical protein
MFILDIEPFFHRAVRGPDTVAPRALTSPPGRRPRAAATPTSRLLGRQSGIIGLGELPADTRRLTAVIEPVSIANVGAVVEMQSPRDTPSEDRRSRLLVSDEPDRLAVTARLFAETARGERLNCERLAMGIGLWRCGPSAIWKGYVGPPALPEDPIERERFLEDYRVRHRDIEDAVNQMLGRDPDQHRPPRLSWHTLIELLSKRGIELSEAQLIALPFRCELSPEVQTRLAAASD